MNYYEKIIQEKQNGNLFLERLKAKSFRSADELERAIKSYVAGGRVISDDANGFTVEAIEDDGKHTYKIYLREDGGTSERVTVEKVVKLNSKGETNMGYYADLIKQKQEKRNSAESHLKGLIGKKFKRDTDLERAVNGSIYTEISDWSHPRMVVFDKYTDEKYILTTEDNNKYGKDQEFWISKVQKANSKEERRNGRSFKDIESAFRYVESKGYTIERRDWHKSNPKSWEWLPVTKDGKKDTIEFFKLSDGTIEVSNSKEEKQNFRADPLGFGPTVVGVGTPDDYKAKFKVGDKVKFYSGEGVIVKGPIKMRFSLTPTYHIKVTKGKETGREVSRYEEELKKNSKDNAKEDVEKIKSQIVSVKAYLKDRLEKQKSIAKEVEGTQRELERLEKLLGQNNSKEEKDNADSAYIEASQKSERIINRMLQSRDKKEAKRFLEKIGWETRTLGEDPADYARAIRRAVRNYPEKSAEILSNSKEEKENDAAQTAYDYALKLAKQTGDPNFFKVLHRSREHFLANPHLISEWIDEMKGYMKKAGIKNSEEEDEKGYYAKLAEEKASRKN